MRVPFKSRAKVKTLPSGVMDSLDAEYASVAQLVEFTTDNRVVTGPNPVVCTIRAQRVSNPIIWRVMSMVEMTKSKSEDVPIG